MNNNREYYSEYSGKKVDSLLDKIDKLNPSVYATKTEVSKGLENKQGIIDDLATIRSGAAKGATSVQSDDLAAVATSGSYSDLSNKPTIPSAYDDSELRGIVEKLENNSPYITDFSVSDLWNSVGSGEPLEIDKEKLRAAFRESRLVLVPEFNDMDTGYRIATGHSDDLLYITVLSYWDTVYYIETNYESNIIYPNEIYHTRFQSELKSGKNIKTINGESILGDGNITIVGGDLSEDEIKGIVGEMVDDVVGDKLEGKVEQNQVGELNLALVDGLDNGCLAYALPDSAYGDEDDILLSRNSVKTINSQSIFGSGNITIKEYNDTTLVNRVAAVEASVSSKANTNGVYPEMSVGLAEYLGSRPFFEDAEFVFRASAGEENSIKDGLASIQSIKGNSVVWNQINDDPYFLNSSIWTSSKITLTINSGVLHGVVSVDSSPSFYGNMYNDANHIYVFTIDYIATEGRCYIYAGGNGANLGNNTGTRQVKGIVFKSGANSSTFSFYPNIEAPVGSEFDIYGIRLYDLTQMFGAGNEPTTIEEFYARIPSGVDMNAYNAGEVISMNTESIKSVGENAWDEQWANGYWNNAGRLQHSDTTIASVNPIKVLPNEQYFVNNKVVLSGNQTINIFFYDIDNRYISHVTLTSYKDSIVTVPSDADRMAFYIEGQTIYNNNIIISLVHSGWKQNVDAGYQPYWEDNLDLSVIGKYFPQGMKKAGSAYDEIRFNKASGKWEAVRRIGEVDMGSLEWVYNNVAGQYRFYSYGIQNSIMKPNSVNTIANIVCSRYIPDSWNTLFVNLKDKIVAAHTGGPIAVFDSAYTDVASFKAAMAGVILYYELAEPIITEIEEDLELFYDVADFGTEEAIASVPSTPFRAKMSYDFNANDSIRNNSVSIRDLKKKMSGLTTKEDVAEAIAIAITTTLNTAV